MIRGLGLVFAWLFVFVGLRLWGTEHRSWPIALPLIAVGGVVGVLCLVPWFWSKDDDRR